ncbi:hypothetical protein P175DRAFT_0492437 [Aspergillus ochraceoroseus IBT 24754]|uniref:CHAT domain-containing protein n=1 Tax=Aspergillus ochraceoroseus IBT 24754 TaxID=1392256 RepID=A0A2T5LZW2_9EURO|nr:uncharacterized protein P175DRAFT_0492437 [Aspergillus ochraceoroseus IBT 24754]PTU21812.1 hypothetical protein P175DRAFT_0492437 [Aspergillus ochraceoroseus IBT 24754]
MSHKDNTPLVIRRYPVLQQVYEALGGTPLYTHHKGDFKAALQIAENECQTSSSVGGTTLAAALTGRGIVRTLQGNCSAALGDLDSAVDMAHPDLPLQMLVYLYIYQATRTRYKLFPDLGPAEARDIQYRFDSVETLQEWQAKTNPLAVAYSTDPPLSVVRLVLRLDQEVTSFPRGRPRSDATFQAVQRVLLSTFDTEYEALELLHPDPGLLGQIRLLRARISARMHGAGEEAMKDVQTAEQLFRTTDDVVGLANIELALGDLVAAPLSSPLVWNAFLAEGTYDTTSYWQIDKAEWEVDSGHIRETMASYQKALDLFASANVRRGMAAARMRLGYVKLLEGMRLIDYELTFAAAKDDFELATALSSEAGDAMAFQLGVAQLALCAIGQGGQPEQTARAASIGSWGCREGSFGFALGIGIFFARIGWRWVNYVGDYERALACFRLAETLFESLQAPLSRIHSIIDQLKVYQMLGDFPSCSRALECALDECIAARHQEPGLAAETTQMARWISIQMLGLATGRAAPHLIERVRGYIQSIRDTHEPSHQEGPLSSLDILQNLFHQLQAGESPSGVEPPLAQEMQQHDPASQITDIFLESQLRDSELYQDLYSGKKAEQEGDIETARALFSRVRSVASSLGSRRHYFDALAYAYEGEFEQAGVAYQQCAAQELGTTAWMERTGLGMALDDDRRRQAASRALSFFCEIGRFNEAQNWLQLLEKSWPDWWKKEGQTWLSLGRIAQVQEGVGNLESALQMYEECISTFEAQRRRLSIDGFKVAFAGDSSTGALFFDYIRTLLKLRKQPDMDGSPRSQQLEAKIFDVAERNKARSLLDLIQGGVAGGISSSDYGPLRRWRRLNAYRTSRCGLLEQELHTDRPDQSKVSALKEDIASVEQLIATAENDMSAAGQPVRSVTAEVSTLGAVCEALPHDMLVLEYMFNRDDLFSWAISSDGMVKLHKSSFPRYWLDRAAKRFHEACKGALQPGTLGKELASELLEPFQELMQHYKRLVIVPHSSLHLVPFHALPLTDNSPLSSSHIVTYLPSVSLLRFLDSREVKDDQSPSVLALGNPSNMSFQDVYGQHHPAHPLPGTRQEVSLIAEILAGSKVFVGDDANSSNLRAHIHDNHSILHLAAHCRLVSEIPLLSSISLANGDELSVLDLLNMQLDVDLVVLSACQTGQGTLTAGNDVVGFSRALLAAGARAVLVSLWPVDDEATCELVRYFYQGVSKGQSFPEALNAAQETLRHSCPLIHPQVSASHEIQAEGNQKGPRAQDHRRIALPRDLQPPESLHPVDYSLPAFWAPFILISGLGQGYSQKTTTKDKQPVTGANNSEPATTLSTRSGWHGGLLTWRIVSNAVKFLLVLVWERILFPSLEALELVERPQREGATRIRWRCVCHSLLANAETERIRANKQTQACGKKFYGDIEGISDADLDDVTQSLFSDTECENKKSDDSVNVPTPARRIPDQGAQAFLIQQTVSKWPVNVPSDLTGLQQAIIKSNDLRLSDPDRDRAHPALLDFQHQADQVIVRTMDGIEVGSQQLPSQGSSANPLNDVLIVAEQLARAQHLLALECETPEEALNHRVETELGLVDNGNRGRIIRPDGSDSVAEQDRVYITLRNKGGGTIYTSVFDVNVAGKISLVSSHSPMGIELPPGRSSTLGCDQFATLLTGIEVTWPKGVPKSQPVSEQLVLVFTDRPVDIRHLANPADRPTTTRGARSNLEQLVYRISYGGSRDLGETPGIASICYDVLQVPFSLHPKVIEPASTPTDTSGQTREEEVEPKVDYSIGEWPGEEAPLPGDEIPAPDANAQWRALPSHPPAAAAAPKVGTTTSVQRTDNAPSPVRPG